MLARLAPPSLLEVAAGQPRAGVERLSSEIALEAVVQAGLERRDGQVVAADLPAAAADLRVAQGDSVVDSFVASDINASQDPGMTGLVAAHEHTDAALDERPAEQVPSTQPLGHVDRPQSPTLGVGELSGEHVLRRAVQSCVGQLRCRAQRLEHIQGQRDQPFGLLLAAGRHVHRAHSREQFTLHRPFSRRAAEGNGYVEGSDRTVEVGEDVALQSQTAPQADLLARGQAARRIGPRARGARPPDGGHRRAPPGPRQAARAPARPRRHPPRRRGGPRGPRRPCRSEVPRGRPAPAGAARAAAPA